MAGLSVGCVAQMPVVLVADDEVAVTGEISDCLVRYGMQALVANTFADALAVLRSRTVDAIILDQRFGSVDTLPMLPQLRSVTGAPILVHTGNPDETDRVLGLELGADDFLVKPVSGRELVARLRARFRRPATFTAPPLPARADASWRLVRAERRLYRPDGSVLSLTTAEFDTLAALADTPGEVQAREDLTRTVFRRAWQPGDRAVDNTVLHLRRKLLAGLGEGCIATVRQMGYVFTGFPAAA